MDVNSLSLNLFDPWKEGRIYEYFIQPEYSEELVLSVCSTLLTILILILNIYYNLRNFYQLYSICCSSHLMAFCIPAVQDDRCLIRNSGYHFEPHCRRVADDDCYQHHE